MVVIVLVALTSAFGAWLGSKLYNRKNRNPVTGAIWGGLAGFFPVLIPIFFVYTLFMRKLTPSDKGYYSTSTTTATQTMRDLGVDAQVAAEMNDEISSENVRVAAARLREIHSMYEQKIITEADYQKLKTKIISEM